MADPVSPPFLPYARHSITSDDIAAVMRALKSGCLTGGAEVASFETELAAACGARHAVACGSGTAALHLALAAAGVGPGQRVLTSALTFLASANCAIYVGAEVGFADVDRETGNVTDETLDAAWSSDVTAVVPVHYAGRPCDMVGIAALARSRGAIVVEDAAHAIGSTFSAAGRSWRVGGHPWADLTTLSFHPAKTMTSGEGGAVLTDDDGLASRCLRLRNHGIVRNATTVSCSIANGDALLTPGPWSYEMAEVGWNHRLSELHAALGRSQLARLPVMIARRRKLARRYDRALAHLRYLRTPPVDDHTDPAWHLYVVQIDFDSIGLSRTQVIHQLRQAGIGTQVHFLPLHLQPFYRQRGGRPGLMPAAEDFYRRCLSLPLYFELMDDDADRVATEVRRVLGQNLL